MNCLNVKEKIVEYLEDLLPEEEKRQMAEHFETCGECRETLSSFSEIHARLVQTGSDNKSADFEHRVIDRIVREQNRRLKQAGALQRRLEKWRYIMKTRTVKFSVAATVAIALIFGIGIITNIPSSATADTFLTQAVKALSGLSSIHMKARMRSRIGDNFGSICLDCDFVPVEMWKQVDDAGTLRWRLQKPVRTIVMDGETTTMVVGEQWAVRIDDPGPLGCCFDSWMGCLLDVRGILDEELQEATENPVRQLVLSHETIDGKDKILLEVDIPTEVPEDDVLRDLWLQNSEHLKVYRFDTETKLLESFQVFVVSEEGDILVFEITDIEYDAAIDDTLLTLELPPGVMMLMEPEILPDNEKYQEMTPQETVSAFFTACLEKNWGEVQKFIPWKLTQDIKTALSEVESFSLGEPFQSESGYQGWFIPYELKVDGETIKRNMSVRNDNDAGRYIIDGGL